MNDANQQTELVKAFEQNYLTVFKEMAENKKLMKQCEEKEIKIKEKLETAMKEIGIKSIDNQYLKIVYVPESHSISIDLKNLEKKEPDLYEELVTDYPKESNRKGYLRFTVK
jgi:hypothetical protein